MAVPKRKTSKSRKNQRKRSHRTSVTTGTRCTQCGGLRRPHRVCPACGYYGGRQVVTVEAA
ncbi:MAG: 50S ribosomal protein L32 [Verrucomicrobia bacterium]|nr:50S ribosomal protein L32 [Verrucomicrobiota bacterium]